MDCVVSAQNATRGGPLVIHATCANARGLYQGLEGMLLDPKNGQAMANGAVRIKTLAGSRIVDEAPKLTKPVPARTLRFYVHTY